MRRGVTAAAVTSALLVLAGSASADPGTSTLGSTTQPSGSSAGSCSGSPGVLFQQTDDSATPYTVRQSGSLTSWSTDTAGGSAGGAQVTLLVLRPASGTYTVIGENTGTLPATGIATFPISPAIRVQPGDHLGFYNTASYPCLYEGGNVDPSDSIAVSTASSAPTLGSTVNAASGSPASFRLNLSATEVSIEDSAVTAGVTSGAAVGRTSVLTSTVTNNGPDSGPITFTDAVPGGLSVVGVAAGSGTCTTAGQVATCSITGLAAGQSRPVYVLVTPTRAGTYTNTVAISTGGFADPNAANNTASATFSVADPSKPQVCTVPKLKGATFSQGKRVLKGLGCKVGKPKRASSRSVPKGSIIKTKPKPGIYGLATKVTVVVSTGPKKR